MCSTACIEPFTPLPEFTIFAESATVDLNFYNHPDNCNVVAVWCNWISKVTILWHTAVQHLGQGCKCRQDWNERYDIVVYGKSCPCFTYFKIVMSSKAGNRSYSKVQPFTLSYIHQSFFWSYLFRQVNYCTWGHFCSKGKIVFSPSYTGWQKSSVTRILKG